jgi:hypothetical protein
MGEVDKYGPPFSNYDKQGSFHIIFSLSFVDNFQVNRAVDDIIRKASNTYRLW